MMSKKLKASKKLGAFLLVGSLLVTSAGCGSSTSASGGNSAGSGDEEKTYTIRLGTVQPQEGLFTRIADKFAAYANEKSGGRLDVKVLPASQLGTAKEQLESVKLGSQEMFIDDTVWLGAYEPSYNITGFAFTFRDTDHVKNFFNGETGKELAEKVRTGHNIKVLTQTLHRVPRNLITTKQIKALDDLKGMKIRVPENPAYVEVWKELKSSPSPMGWGEVYTAMQQGVIEGAESPTDILFDSKLSEVAKYLTQTEHIRATGSLIINDKTFQALPDDLKKIMEEAALEAEKFNDEEFKKVDKEAIEKMKAAGVTITQLNSDDFRNAIKDLPQKLEEKNIWPKGLYEKIQSVK